MAPEIPAFAQPFYTSLRAVSSPVAQHYIEVATCLHTVWSATELQTWSQYCVAIAQSGWRTWESTEAFLQVTPLLQRQLRSQDLWAWAAHGQTLAQVSADVATAFFHAAPLLLQGAAQDVFPAWVASGQWYLQRHPVSLTLAVDYFHLSARIYSHYAPPAAALWSQLGQRMTQAGGDYGQRFLALTRTHLERTPQVDHTPAWTVTHDLVPAALDLAYEALERYADLVQRWGAEHVATLYALLPRVAPPATAAPHTFLRLARSTLGLLAAPERAQALTWCQQIATLTPAGALAFVQQLPALRQHLPGARLQPWIASGLEVAQRHADAGAAYFALESHTAQERLRVLQSTVTFAHIEPVLRLYTEAMLGRTLLLRTTAELPPALHHLGADVPTSDGTSIFVPEQVNDLPTAQDNFAVYKLAILHQMGWYAYGTFGFRLDVCQQRLPHLGAPRETPGKTPHGLMSTAFAQFFACFPDAALAQHVFTLCEGARIDAALLRQYRGIQREMALIRHRSVQQRPALRDLPLRQALLEGLLQLTLGQHYAAAAIPRLLRPLLRHLDHLLQPLYAANATVYDTAAATHACYLLITQLPLHALSSASEHAMAALETLADTLADDADSLELAELFRQAGMAADTMPELPTSDAPATGLAPVPYRGDVKPELIQQHMRLAEGAELLQDAQQALGALPPEVLQKLLEQGDLTIRSLQAGDLTATSGLFLTNLEGREDLAVTAADQQAALQQTLAALQAEQQRTAAQLVPQPQAFLYDEWDYLIGDYRHRWCRLTETVLDDGERTFVTETRQRHADLLAQIAKQLQLLKPETFTPRKRLVDGAEIDLDSAIEALVDRRANHTLPDKVYMRRDKRERSVAAVFLLDMSASTDDTIPETPSAPGASPPVVRPYDFSGFVQEDTYLLAPRQAAPPPARRRIIDLEKEAVVLMADALEGLGDAYAVYGFSGYGRDQVDFFVVKEFAEPYDAQVQGRLGAIKPHRSTRMGPAIRHALRKLDRQEARLKLLLLLSDGYPQDFDYGKDRKSKEYGIQDTMMALHEAGLKGVQTFCITVDPAGHEYLRAMCPDQRYLVLEDMASLPKELPKVYRSLTT